MVSIAQSTYKIAGDSAKWLKNKGVDIPDGATCFEYILVPKFTEYTELFTFKDAKNLRLTQIKNKVNKTTQEKETQLREYDYTGRIYGKEKISEIRQKNIDSKGQEEKTLWRFYHPKDKTPVRFSRKENLTAEPNLETEVNNYLRADGYIVDRSGLKIKPISTAEYADLRKDIPDENFVASPWTLKQTITTKEKCATDSVQECTVVGIYGEKGITLNHLNPNNAMNRNFNKIENSLLEQLEQQGKNAKAFVIGSCESDRDSNKQFLHIIDFLATRGVKYSRFKTGDNILYGPMHYETKVTSKNSNKYKYNQASPYEWVSGQHIIYDNGELKIANPIIDAELKKGNTDPESLIKKSFYRVYR